MDKITKAIEILLEDERIWSNNPDVRKSYLDQIKNDLDEVGNLEGLREAVKMFYSLFSDDIDKFQDFISSRIARQLDSLQQHGFQRTEAMRIVLALCSKFHNSGNK